MVKNLEILFASLSLLLKFVFSKIQNKLICVVIASFKSFLWKLSAEAASKEICPSVYQAVALIYEFWSNIIWFPNPTDFIWYLSIGKWKRQSGEFEEIWPAFPPSVPPVTPISEFWSRSPFEFRIRGEIGQRKPCLCVPGGELTSSSCLLELPPPIIATYISAPPPLSFYLSLEY